MAFRLTRSINGNRLSASTGSAFANAAPAAATADDPLSSSILRSRPAEVVSPAFSSFSARNAGVRILQDLAPEFGLAFPVGPGFPADRADPEKDIVRIQRRGHRYRPSLEKLQP